MKNKAELVNSSLDTKKKIGTRKKIRYHRDILSFLIIVLLRLIAVAKIFIFLFKRYKSYSNQFSSSLFYLTFEPMHNTTRSYFNGHHDTLSLVAP